MTALVSKTAQTQDDVIDLGKLFGILIDNRWMIIIVTMVFAIVGVSYALLATPVYKADALVQVEKKSTGMPALGGDMADLFSSESSATTEIEILKSRMVLGKTVEQLNLTTVTSANYFPIVGKGIARLLGQQQSIDVEELELPKHEINPVELVVKDQTKGLYQLLNSEDEPILTGEVGKLATANTATGEYQLLVNSLNAENGDSFTLAKRSRLNAIQWLQANLSISERGKQTGILQLTFMGANPTQIQAILNDISENYLLQNVARNAAEAENSLVFLKRHLPEIKKQLNTAEEQLNKYRQANESVNLDLETKATLQTMVELEAQLNELTFKESDISQRFTKDHPAYIALLDKRNVLLHEKSKLNKRVEQLPKTQREVLSLMRDVQVNQQIYIQLLNKVQELNIVKASTVGNVRILDSAQTYSAPVKPKKPLIVVISILLGGMLAVAIALLKAAFNRGIESPEQVEVIGLPVYASIPLSDTQLSIAKKIKTMRQPKVEQVLLAKVNPADLAVEAFRGLRTSLHFAMMEAKNNVLMISGPSPAVGKSFVSANMAAVIAKAEQRVLIIDADMRKGRIEQQLGLSSSQGLSDYLSGQLPLTELVKTTSVDNLDFISRGAVPPNPSELLMHPRFAQLLEWASKHYDMVVVDTPPILAVTDAAIVGRLAGTSLIVGRFEQTALKEVEITKQRFEQNGIEVKGFILNAVERKASSYYGSYGYYQYGYCTNEKNFK